MGVRIVMVAGGGEFCPFGDHDRTGFVESILKRKFGRFCRRWNSRPIRMQKNKID
jgi:hypothetical protein